MSIIAQLKNTQRENVELKQRLSEMENDVTQFATKFKEFWQLLNLDFSKKSESEEKKEITGMELAKSLMKVGKDFMFGKLKKQDFTDKWDAVAPILEKYNHLIDTENV